jgi:cytochrome c oxidase subunit 3
LASSPLADRHGHGVHGHHGRHAPAHQFDTMEQQKESSTLAMWLFLVTEIMFFGGLFLAYVIYRTAYPDAFAAASHTLNVWWGGFNTAVLIGSSLTMVLAVWAAQVNWRKGIVLFLLLTIALGSVFLGVKAIEYKDKFTHHHVPGASFEFDGPQPENAEIFFSLYFIMTGLHATHMVIGIGVLAVLAFYAWKGKYDSEYYNPLEMTGLYWHFVDIVWIFLFPLLYLLGAHIQGGAH